METVAPLFTALVCLSLALSSLIRGTRDRLAQEFAYLAGVLSIVFLCLFFLIVTDESFWRYVLLLSALLIPPAVLQTYGWILRRYDPPIRHLVPVMYVAAVLQAGAILVLRGREGMLVSINAVIVFGGLTATVLGVLRGVGKIDRPVERDRIRALLWTGGFAVLAMGMEMAFLDWNFFSGGRTLLFPPIGSIAVVAHIWLLGQVVTRHRLLDRREIVSQMVVFVVMALVLASVYGILVRLIGQSSGPFAEAIDTVIASILVIILYEPVKDATARQIDRLLARERSDQIHALRELKLRMPSLIEIEDLVDAILDGTLATGRVDLSSMYLYDDGRDGYRLRAFEGHPEQPLLPAFPPRPFIDGYLEGHNWYLFDDFDIEVSSDLNESEASWRTGVRAQMQSLQTDLSLPLRIGNSILGVWNLRLQPGSPPLAARELELLHELADQAAVLIDNSRAFEAMKERDRLATLGEMSAGLAHEIRNPLGAIKGAVQYLGKGKLEGVSKEFLDIILEEVDRLDGVVSQFLDYARPVNMLIEPVQPDLLLRGVIAMARAQGLPGDVLVDYESGDVPPVPMDIEKLKQVVLNLVLNGIESMANSGGTLTVRSRLRDGSGSRVPSLRQPAPGVGTADVRVKRGSIGAGPAVELIFEDEGSGISPDNASKLFIPFFTTKTQGTGLGLPICERIVREHGGELEVDSLPGTGSRFTLRLPLTIAPIEDEATEVDQAPVGSEAS